MAYDPISTPEWYDEDLDDETRADYSGRTAVMLEEIGSEVVRRAMADVHVRMFENSATPLNMLSPTGGILWSALADRKIWNVLRAVVTSLEAIVSKTRPRPRFTSTNARPGVHREVHKLNQFVDGIYSANKVYETGRMCFRDDLLAQAGAAIVYDDGRRVRIDRVIPTQVLVDPNDAQDGFQRARTIGWWRNIDRSVLLARLGKTEEQKLAILSARGEDPSGQGLKTNQVKVYELWHRQSGPDAKDGRHIIVIPGQHRILLANDKWPYEWVPLVFMVTDPAVAGAWGRSLAEGVAPIQLSIDNLLQRIHRNIKANSTPRYWLGNGRIAHISNEPGSFVQGTGAPPQLLQTNAAIQEPLTLLREHRAAAFDFAGISEGQSTGTRTPGLESGEAIRADAEIQSSRQAVRQQRYEDWFVELAKVSVNVARQLYKRNPGLLVNVKLPGRRFLQSIKWSEIHDLEDTDFEVDLYPTNILPDSPGGRIDTVTDLVKGGVWGSARAEAALDDLDIESEFTRERAQELRIEAQMEAMAYDGKAQHPDEYTDPPKAVDAVTRYINIADFEHLPEHHVELLHDYADALKEMMVPKGPAPGAAEQVAGAQAPTPTGDLAPGDLAAGPAATPMTPEAPLPQMAPPIPDLTPQPLAPPAQ